MHILGVSELTCALLQGTRLPPCICSRQWWNPYITCMCHFKQAVIVYPLCVDLNPNWVIICKNRRRAFWKFRIILYWKCNSYDYMWWCSYHTPDYRGHIWALVHQILSTGTSQLILIYTPQGLVSTLCIVVYRISCKIHVGDILISCISFKK